MRRQLWLGLAFSLVAAGCGGGVNSGPVASTAITPTNVSDGQSTLYQVQFVNQSGLSGTALIVPHNATAPFVNLVWWAAQSSNGSTVSYNWYNTYAVFYSAATPQLLPGVVVEVSGSQLPIDRGSIATLTTSGGSGSPYFSVQIPPVQGFGLGSDYTIAYSTYSEGFSLNNAPLQAMPAVPEESVIWNPPTLDIGFSTEPLLPGEVVGYELFDHTPLNVSGGAVTVTYTAAHTFVTSP